MILADTSVWIDHLRKADPALQSLVSESELLIHPAVIGELACGHLTRRNELLSYLANLPRAPVADWEETVFAIESRKLWGRGIGWIDAQLVASALVSGSRLWTHDRRLHEVAAALHIAYAN